MHIVVVPILLGRGVRLWDGLEGLEKGYQIEATSSPSGVTHVTFTRADAMSDERPVTLAEAYALQTPEDSRRLYARWAATYESEFVALNQYVIPDRVAAVFAEVGRTWPAV